MSLCLTACFSDKKRVDEALPITSAVAAEPEAKPIWKPNVSQQFNGQSEIEQRLAIALPEIPYSLDGLSEFAQKVNTQLWQNDETYDNLTTEQIIKIQALLNWHHHKVGAVDGKFNANTVKAMNVFQYKHNLPLTQTMNEATWQALTQDKALLERPVLVKYTLTKEDVDLFKYPERTRYKKAAEAIAERFQMSRQLLTQLNPNTPLQAGNSIIVYNPAQPNMQAVTRVIADKKRNILFAYNEHDELVASYPTTVGGRNSPSPTGKHRVVNRHIDPSYNKDFKNKASSIPGGPNNPVGRVWMGLSKKSFGIHGSPEPEMISHQKSAGCVRLTNWDALSLFGTIQHGAEVEFVEKDYMMSKQEQQRSLLITQEQQKLEQLKQQIEQTSASN
ncbi:L,D-transpeptidase family protein [Moraxella sp. ZY210820]|uniref:L,D-transpeptidase family protein n=1 Tax=unclassified Moraxella TaxID=2685852 RepID=UPI00272F787E|nr:L,D-transpeptidase family protein [Moraxella sp. ZY210820]WLF83279.1 L,D-transpeptidase family protein [Moraxella sp. ZY210820]